MDENELLISMNKQKAIITTGLATFFFGFGAGAVLNLYLISIKSPLVEQFRSSLSYISSIYGDGILLPIVNMVMVAFLYKSKQFVSRRSLAMGFTGGLLITAYFHITQALNGIVNWTMPTPWHWNFLGVWHALYMLAVTSLITLFYVVSVLSFRKNRKIPKEAYLVTLGIISFLMLLRFDYADINLSSLIPK